MIGESWRVNVVSEDFGRRLDIYVVREGGGTLEYLTSEGGETASFVVDAPAGARIDHQIRPLFSVDAVLARQIVEAITGHAHPDHEAVAHLVKAHERAEARVDKLIDAILAPPTLTHQESPRGT